MDSNDRTDAPDAEVEQRLTDALEQRAASVQPGPGDLAGIEARVAAEQRRNRRRTGILAAAAAVAVVAGVAAVLTLSGDDDEPVATEDPTTTTAPTTTEPAPTTTTSTTTTIRIDDDGVPGWPGFVARVFDNPESAAIAFAEDVLGFAEATLAEGTTEGDEAEYTIHPNPRAAASTRVHVHDTGEVRGWVVTGATSSQGSIDEVVSNANGTITISGTATAFEATVTVEVLDLEGNVLEETSAMAGSNGEMGPYTATLGEFFEGTPAFVLVGAPDESGEGRFVWAAVELLS